MLGLESIAGFELIEHIMDLQTQLRFL